MPVHPFTVKPISQFNDEMEGQQRLRRILGPVALTSLGVGAIIGAGIFVLTGLAAHNYAGPGLILSFVVAGLGCAFAALSYAEFASMLPVAGSAYTYAYATMGELMAWIIGWDLILEYSMASSAVAVGWSGYVLKLLQLFHVKIPLWLANDYWTCVGAKAAPGALLEKLAGMGIGADQAQALIARMPNVHDIDGLTAAVKGLTLAATANLKEVVVTLQGLASAQAHLANFTHLDIPVILGIPIAFNLPAFLVILAVTAILVKGIRESASFNAAMVIIKLAVVLFVIAVGSFYIDPRNWSPFLPFGFSGVMAGAAYVFFAYIGFDSISTHAEEAVNPQRDVPIGILTSLGVCTVLYIAVAAVMTGMERYSEIDISAPIASAFVSHGLTAAVLVISVAAVAGITSVLLVMMLSQPRVFLAMARDGLLPRKVFGVVHPKFRTPHRSTMLMGGVVSLVAALTPIEDIAKMVNIGTLLAFVIVCIAVPIMRRTNPDHHRPFRCPWSPVIPVLGVVFNGALMFSLGWVNWLRLFVWLAAGLAIYWFYGRHHSTMAELAEAKAAGATKP